MPCSMTREGGRVLGRLNQFGGWAGDAFKGAKTGGHAPYGGDLDLVVRDTDRLTQKLRQ